MKGIEIYRTQAEFCVLRLHYSADPDKDPSTEKGSEWLAHALRGTPGGLKSVSWRTEREIDFSAGGGETVFHELLQLESEIYIDPFEIPEAWARYASFDYGHRNPSSIHFYAVSPQGWKYAYFEFYSTGMHYKGLVDVFKSHPDFNNLTYISADPSLWRLDQQSGEGVRSLGELFWEEGIYLRDRCQNSDIKGIERIREHWNRPKGEKALLIMKSCPKLWWELKNLKFQENKRPTEHSNPEKIVDKDNHAFDDLKYFLLSLPEPSQEPDKVVYHSEEWYDEAEARQQRFRDNLDDLLNG